MTFRVQGKGRVDPGAHGEIEEAFRQFVLACEAAEVPDGVPFEGGLVWSHWTGDGTPQPLDGITATEVRAAED